MAINATTLTAAIGNNDTSLVVASATGITSPIFNTGVGITYVFCEQEWMLVTSVTGTVVSVQRGILGSSAQPHAASTPIVAGLPSDFPAPTITQRATQDSAPQLVGFSAPIAGANTNVATGPFFHLTGTTIMKTLTAPNLSDFEGAAITIVFDGSAAGLTWDNTGNISVGGSASSAGSSVTFVFDQGSGKWHPSRVT